MVGVVFFQPAGKVFGLGFIEGIDAVAFVGARKPSGRVVPREQLLVDLAGLYAVGHPPQPQFIVLGKRAIAVRSELLEQLAAEHDRWVGEGRFDEAVERNLGGFDQLVDPIDVRGVARLLFAVAAKPDAATDEPGLRKGIEERDLLFDAFGVAEVVGIHAGNVFAVGGGQPVVERGHDAPVRMVEQLDVRLVPQNLQRRVGRAVIDDHDFHGLEGLRPQAFQALENRGFGIEHRHDDGDVHGWK